MENDFTYQSKASESSLEKYEWDNVWWEQTGNRTAQRVLYIGDSISCGIRRIATDISHNTLLFDGFGSSKALDNRFYKDSIVNFANQQGTRSIVIFNNGLHGFHLNTEEYKIYYKEIVEFLIKQFSNTPVALVLTTDVTNDNDVSDIIIKRNKIAGETAKLFNLPVIDLYSVSKQCSNLHTDGVHFNSDGYKCLAEELINRIKEII